MSVTLESVSHDHAFEQFLGEQYPALVNFLCGRGVLHHDAQDIAQESLFKVTRYRNLPVENLRPLLYRIALNALHDSRRREGGVLRTSLSDTTSHAYDIPDEMPQPEQWTEHKEEVARIRAAIDRLPTRCKEVYLLNRIDGMSYSQISRNCGISIKAVEKHIAKALSSLRKTLVTPAGSAEASTSN